MKQRQKISKNDLPARPAGASMAHARPNPPPIANEPSRLIEAGNGQTANRQTDPSAQYSEQFRYDCSRTDCGIAFQSSDP
jgi:hypothetical protein